ncbi:MAG: hypothetical protein AB8G95_20515, partial [Anaerolineae bacterium]
WFFVPIGLMMILPSSVFVHPHYLLFTLPAGGIIAAVGLDWGMQQHKNLVWIVIVFLFLIGLQFFDSLDRSRSKAQQNPYVYGLDAIPLRTASEVGRQLRHPLRSLGVKQYPIRIVSESTDQMISAISATWVDVVGGLDPFEWSIVQSKSALIYLQPSEGGFEYAGGKFTQDKSRNFIFPDEKLRISELDEYLEQGLDGKPKFSRYVVHYLLTVDNPLHLVEQQVDLETDAGFGLLGYSINQLDEDSYQIKTYWRVDTLHDARNEWFVSPFVHLINDQGVTVANVAPHGQWGHRWRVGDVYVSTVTLDRPADAVQLGIGLFDPISGQTFLLNGPDGNVPRFEAQLP